MSGAEFAACAAYLVVNGIFWMLLTRSEVPESDSFLAASR
jgi:hypothetical protein